MPSPLQHYYSESNGFYIYNHLESDSVFSITAGTVINSLKFDEDIFCVVLSGRRIISYGPFKFCPLIIGNDVKRGDYIDAMNDDGLYLLLALNQSVELFNLLFRVSNPYMQEKQSQSRGSCIRSLTV